MDLAPTASPKSAEPEPPRPVSFSNGVLKRHHHQLSAPPVVVSYRECLKNHAATLGGHALDGCGEFMPSADLKCAACGCHRNFHRREPEEPPHTHVIEYQPPHRHHPPPPHGSPNSASPPPISSSYYPSAPHMLLALSALPNQGSRKRFRTKFSQAQKEKMQEFADRVGWKIHKRDDQLVHRFCHDVGVDRGVLKVWMHNNKNTLANRDTNGNAAAAAGQNPDHQNHQHDNGPGPAAAAANGSSSSS